MTVKENIQKLETEKPEPVIKDILPTDKIIGVRFVRNLVHVWLLDSRTSTARRIEFGRDDFTAESLIAAEMAVVGLELRNER